jgi:hypothetical protein
MNKAVNVCVVAVPFGNKLCWFESQYQVFFFFFFLWIFFKLKIIHLNIAVMHKFFNYVFKTYLCSIGSAREASDAGICYFFVILFSFFTNIFI